jgi:hypothetical protein
MRRTLLSGLLLLFALPLVVFAQGTQGPPVVIPAQTSIPTLSTERMGNPPDAFATRSLTAKILKIHEAAHSLIVEDATGRRVEVAVTEKTRLKADKQTELADRQKLSLTDFKVGQTVKVTFFVRDGEVAEVRLRRVKN